MLNTLNQQEGGAVVRERMNVPHIVSNEIEGIGLQIRVAFCWEFQMPSLESVERLFNCRFIYFSNENSMYFRLFWVRVN